MPSRPFLISEPAQVRALASAVRQDIIDAVTAIGPATAPEIARSLRRRPDSLYFHLRLLTKVGLLNEGEQPNGKGRMVANYDVPGRPMRIIYDLSEQSSARAISRVTASMLRTANRGFARSAATGQARISGSQRELWAARTRGWLTNEGLKEANAIFHRLIELVSRGPAPENACSYEITFVLSPARSA